MTTEVLAKVDLSKAAEELRDKIRSAFIDLIPPEQWDEMVKEEWRKFLSSREDKWNHKELPSDFSLLCRSILGEEVKQEVRRVLDSPEWSVTFRGEVSEQVKKVIIDNRGLFVDAMLSSMMGTAIQTALAGIRNE